MLAATAAAALPTKFLEDKEGEITRDLETVIRKHGLSVAARTPAHLLALYLYKSLVLFSQLSEMRDRNANT